MGQDYLPTVEDAKEIKEYLIEDMKMTTNPLAVKTLSKILNKLSKEQIYFFFWLLEYQYQNGYDDAMDDFEEDLDGLEDGEMFDDPDEDDFF